MTKRKKKIIYTILLIFAGAAAFVWLRSYVLSEIRTSLISRLESLKVSGFNVEYDSISLDLRRNTIFIEGLVLQKNAYDTSCIHPEFIAISKIRANGFRLLPLLFQNTLSFKSLHLDKPQLAIRENSRLMADGATQRENEFSLAIDQMFITAANVEYVDSLSCELKTSMYTHLILGSLRMDFGRNEPFSFSVRHLAMDSTQVKLPEAFYTFKIKHTRIDFAKHTLEVDSLHIMPDFGKVQFGKTVGYEIDRFEGVVPFFKSSDISFSYSDSILFSSRLAEVSFYLKIFRDKRLPFKYKIKPLPILALRDLPFTLIIDTLQVRNSYVQYEEFGEEATEAGGIFFDNVVATVENIANYPSAEGETRVKATASLMRQGKVQLYVTMPWNENEKTQLAGTLVDFPMSKINPMLEPSTNIKVESGNVKELSFNFVYNDTRSDGEIIMNYTDLKLITFKEGNGKKGEEGEKDNFKSFILNTFVIRKNMDKDVSKEKRTGTVMFVRDKGKSVFNYWAKSLMSGIKSAYNLEKVIEKKEKQSDNRSKN